MNESEQLATRTLLWYRGGKRLCYNVKKEQVDKPLPFYRIASDLPRIFFQTPEHGGGRHM